MRYTTARLATLGVALLGAHALTGCAGGQQLNNPFTKPGELKALTSAPAPKGALSNKGKAVAQWTMQGTMPLARASAPITPTHALERLLLDKAQGKAKATEAMRCAAQQVVTFYLEHNKQPDDSLDDFIGMRCGINAPGVSWQSSTYTLDAGMTLTPEKLVAEHADKMEALLKRAIPSGAPHAEVGMFFAQRGAQAMILVASAVPKATFDDGSMVREANGSFIIKGQLHVAGQTVRAMITLGEFGYANCVTNTAVALPRFEVRCQGDPNDPWTSVQLAVGRRDELRMQTIGQLMMLKPNTPVSTYVPSQTQQLLADRLEQAAPSRPEQISGEFVELVNLVRKRAGLGPLRMELAQTATATRVAPHYFQAEADRDRARGDKLMMGLLAGWDVQGPIAGADFSSYSTGRSTTAHLLLRMLESPSGRETLLKPESDRIAAGIIAQEGALGGVISTYEPLPEESHARRVSRALERLNAARSALGRKPLNALTAHNHDAQKLAAAITSGAKSVESAANDLAQLVMVRNNRSVRIFNLTLFPLDRIDQYKELINAATFDAAIMIAPYRPEGFPWTVYAVVLVIPA